MIGGDMKCLYNLFYALVHLQVINQKCFLKVLKTCDIYLKHCEYLKMSLCYRIKTVKIKSFQFK